MTTLLIFFLILSILVLIHEFGHFYVAKKSGCTVHEFGLGLPPKLFGKKFGETEYTLNALPFGGFVRIEGEDPEEGAEDDPGNFQNKSPLTRLSILMAGIFMNTVLAVVIFYVFFGFNSFVSNPIVKFAEFNFIGAQEQNVSTVVSGIQNEEVKDELENGDVIFNGTYSGGANSLSDVSKEQLSAIPRSRRTELLAQVKVEDFQEFINNSEGQVSLDAYNIQSNKFKTVSVTPNYDEELDRKVIGIFLGQITYLDYNSSLLTKAASGITHSYNIVGYSLKTFSSLIGSAVQTGETEPLTSGVSGPVGIFSVVNSVLTSGGQVFWTLLDLIGILSISLALMNILPIPALDGGRAVFVVYEMVVGKKASPKVESIAHQAGMVLLLILIGLVTFKDILNLL